MPRVVVWPSAAALAPRLRRVGGGCLFLGWLQKPAAFKQDIEEACAMLPQANFRFSAPISGDIDIIEEGEPASRLSSIGRVD